MNWFQRGYYWFGFALVIYGLLGTIFPLPPLLQLSWGLTTALSGALLMQIGLTWFRSPSKSKVVLSAESAVRLAETTGELTIEKETKD